ncbi:AvrD family protein [Streptomyces luteireticuli]|uniref:AvrD family protein n=1 Tax=Streptomyces luteireticuli TaxID=173858 RepID=UPI003555EC42
MNQNLLLFDSFDACLGPGESRFFGSGYTRVSQHLDHIVSYGSTAPGAEIHAWATLDYPRDWSRKSAAPQLRPHVSSIDVLLLAVTLCEVHLSTAHGLTPDQLGRAWLRSADVRAGSRPHETLSDFPVRGRLADSRPAPDGEPGPLHSTYDCRVGGLRARCVLVHERGARTGGDRPDAHVFGSVTDVLGPAGSRVYGAAHKAHRHVAGDVAVDLTHRRVRARQRLVRRADAPPVRHGLEAAYAPSVTVVDGLVGAAQLAQALLYAQDGLDRAGSNTLWMRRMTIGTDTPVRPVDGPFDVRARATHNRLLSWDGGLWRTTDCAVDDFRGIHGSFSVAHRLPAHRAA